MDIDMSATRQQMLETAERLNQQMTDGIPFTWETLEQALASVTEPVSYTHLHADLRR